MTMTTAKVITGVPIVERDIEYTVRNGQSMRMDVFRPFQDGVNRPAVVLIHGGAWSQQDKRVWYGEAARFAIEGFVAICIDYRMLNGELAMPSQIENVRSAIRFLRANAARFGMDPNRISTFGGSAGGHLAALAAYQPDPLQPEARIKCTLVWSGFFDLRANYDYRGNEGLVFDAAEGQLRDKSGVRRRAPVEVVIGGTPLEYPEKYALYSPITYIDVAPVPAYMVVSTDEVSPQSDTEAFAEKLKAKGVPYELVVIEGTLHTRQYSPYVIEDSVKFLKTYG